VERFAYAPEELLGPLNDVERKNAPEKLFTAGDIELLRSGPRVSVIGTRMPSEQGKKRAEQLCRTLVERQVIIVSGLAQGIDTAAHTLAIKHKGRTIAVLGTPLDKTYPKSNEDLQREIIREHLAISQFPSGYPGRPANFPVRNRTMALISHATVIVEAGEGSGTIHQGWEALRLGRTLFLMESLLKNAALKWPKEMISYGARVLTKDTLESLFEILPQDTLSADLPF
jgi:DNA processing protein